MMPGSSVRASRMCSPSRQRAYGAVLTCAVLVLAIAFGAGCSSDSASENPELAKVRIGYPVTTLINGQVGLVLEKTGILRRHGFDADVIRFTHGPPQNEALAAGRIDVALTSEGPAVLGIAQGIDALVVSSFGTTRDAVLVPEHSAIHTANDLRGRSIGVPFGTTPFLHLVSWLRREGLEVDKDVKLVNIEPEQLAAAFEKGAVDAVEYNEPLPTRLESALGARAVGSDELAYAAVIRRAYLDGRREQAARLLAAIAEATLYMASHKRTVDRWFAEASRADVRVVQTASAHTAVYRDTTRIQDVELAIDAQYVERLQQDARLFESEGFAKTTPDMRRYIDTRLWPMARALIEKDPSSFDAAAESGD
jgi:sulfonate transport system substrate-binding protein